MDFTYEVSRSLAACEGAILLVDAAQGLEAQTLANYHLARDAGLTIVPVLNKIDLPAAEPEQRADELGKLLDRDPEEILRVSAKSGAGVTELLKTVIDQVPPPVGDADAPLQALIFDSAFDTYRGVITYVRVQAGRLPSQAKIKMFATRVTSEAEEAGVMAPEATPVDALGPGEVGYLVTGLKDVHQAKVGDTITLAGKGAATEPLPGYREPKPMVWSGLFPADGSDYSDLREALDKLKLSDSALVYEPETSQALGFGFRVGFLGLLHMDIVRERLEREFDLELISTAPNVEFHVFKAGDGDGRAQPRRDAIGRRLRARRGARRVRDGDHPRATTSARCSSSVRTGVANRSISSTSRPNASRCTTCSRSPRSSSISSIS